LEIRPCATVRVQHELLAVERRVEQEMAVPLEVGALRAADVAEAVACDQLCSTGTGSQHEQAHRGTHHDPTEDRAEREAAAVGGRREPGVEHAAPHPELGDDAPVAVQDAEDVQPAEADEVAGLPRKRSDDADRPTEPDPAVYELRQSAARRHPGERVAALVEEEARARS